MRGQITRLLTEATVDRQHSRTLDRIQRETQTAVYKQMALGTAAQAAMGIAVGLKVQQRSMETTAPDAGPALALIVDTAVVGLASELQALQWSLARM